MNKRMVCGGELIRPRITLFRGGCPEELPYEFTAEIDCSRYGIAQDAVVQVRFHDPDVPKSTSYCVCRVIQIQALPNYMDGKRSRVTFVRVEKGGAK